ncbi:MAG: radical SAM protein [bacterium]|nr:MAG: radical SAM protein [bacterium]
MDNNNNAIVLNKALRVFFLDALRIALKNPSQVVTFFRTIKWLRKAAKLRVSWKEQDVLVPPIIIFSITNQCNLQCEGCYNQSFHHSTNGELSDEKLRSITNEAKGLGVSFFVIAGGEPFMRPVFTEIMKDYPEIIFLVFTNGLLINNEMIDTFKKHRNIVPLISLEGNAEDTDQRRGEGTFATLQNIMEKMNRKAIFFGTSLTLTRPNFAAILDNDYTKSLVNSGCKFFLYLEYTPTTPGTEDWVLNLEQRSQVMDLMKTFRSRYPALFIAVPWDEDDVGGCLSAGRGFVHINAAGDLEPCPFAPFSDTNVRDFSLKQALQSELFKKILQRPELSRENGGGCVLWKERELVQSLLDKKYQ